MYWFKPFKVQTVQAVGEPCIGFNLSNPNSRLDVLNNLNDLNGMNRLEFYFPFHTGGRFSANARGPSLASSVIPINAERSASNRNPSSSGNSTPFLIASLMNATDIGAPLSIRPARSSAVLSTSAEGTALFTNPNDLASRPLTVSPVRHISMALVTPTAGDRRCVPPAPGMIPRRTSVSPSLASSAATRRSHARANSNPPPTQ